MNYHCQIKVFQTLFTVSLTFAQVLFTHFLFEGLKTTSIWQEFLASPLIFLMNYYELAVDLIFSALGRGCELFSIVLML